MIVKIIISICIILIVFNWLLYTIASIKYSLYLNEHFGSKMKLTGMLLLIIPIYGTYMIIQASLELKKDYEQFYKNKIISDYKFRRKEHIKKLMK